ncbi:hypothetical protein Pmani_027709 [Petrolisthes manimaculis]|uniref:Uncharacterized protein n=1 Tax=Petrolisthes manimaculis TaxID=1843537 RepID=A0AAE1TYT6_9EUCA|nr:hypothetical protein Pmani_027709 [Petrolisthes manimaculis]
MLCYLQHPSSEPPPPYSPPRVHNPFYFPGGDYYSLNPHHNHHPHLTTTTCIRTPLLHTRPHRHHPRPLLPPPTQLRPCHRRSRLPSTTAPPAPSPLQAKTKYIAPPPYSPPDPTTVLKSGGTRACDHHQH